MQLQMNLYFLNSQAVESVNQEKLEHANVRIYSTSNHQPNDPQTNSGRPSILQWTALSPICYGKPSEGNSLDY